jgi:hypothetical protein
MKDKRNTAGKKDDNRCKGADKWKIKGRLQEGKMIIL